MTTAPVLDGIHHLKLPVSDLDRSLAWYQGHLGYFVMTEFIEEGVRMGVAMRHPNGGPDLALRLDPDRARAAAGFDYFAIGVPGHGPIEALGAHFTERGVPHDGVHRTPVGWVLLGVKDPDGHDVRFYTVPLELPDEAFLKAYQGEAARAVAKPKAARRGLGALLMAPLFLIACGSDDERGSDATSAASTTAANESTSASPLLGSWRTAASSIVDAEATLTDAGLAEWIDEFRIRSPFQDGTVLVLEIGDEWDLYGEAADGTRTEIDYNASYEIDGDQVVVIHSAGTNTFRWTIAGDTLTLEHIESSFPPFEGVPEEVFQKALYMTAEFTRVPSDL